MAERENRPPRVRILDLLEIWATVAAEGSVSRERLRTKLVASTSLQERHGLSLEDAEGLKRFNTRLHRDLQSLRGDEVLEEDLLEDVPNDWPLISFRKQGEEWIRTTGALPGLWIGLQNQRGELDPGRVLAFREFLDEVRLAIDPHGPAMSWLEKLDRLVKDLPAPGRPPRIRDRMVELYTVPMRQVSKPGIPDRRALDEDSCRVLFDALDRQQTRIEVVLTRKQAERIPGQPANQPERRTISPTRLVQFNGRQCIEGVETSGGRALVIFPFARIRQIVSTDQRVVPEDLAWAREQAREARRAWGLDGYEREGRRKNRPSERVVLRFRDSSIGLVEEEPGHREATLTREKVDGQRTLRYEVVTVVGHHFLRWLRAWGPEVEVLEPADLRDRLRRESAQLAARYASPLQEVT